MPMIRRATGKISSFTKESGEETSIKKAVTDAKKVTAGKEDELEFLEEIPEADVAKTEDAE
jgi:hypothetical protein